jgi:hypothetical protein
MILTRPANPRFSASITWPTISLTHHSPAAGCHEAAWGGSACSKFV